MDFIPFTKRMRMTIENYGPNGQGPRGQYAYSSTAFWYQAELTPPFDELRGVKYTGGDDPAGKPTPMEYNPHAFADLNADNLRTYGLGITFAQQAEVLLADAVKAGTAKIVTDALRPYEFDRERAVDFGTVTAGQKLGDIKLKVDSDAVYYPRLYTAPEAGIADLSLERRQDAARSWRSPSPTCCNSGALPHQGRTHDRASWRPRPAMRSSIACSLSPPRGSPRPSKPRSWPSFGPRAGPPSRARAIRSPASVPAACWNSTPTRRARDSCSTSASVRPCLTSSEFARCWARRRPSSRRSSPINRSAREFDLYAADRRLGPSVLPLGPVPAGASEVEIRVVGSNKRSQGHDVELDYIRWEPNILGPGTAEGVWAQVVGTHDCEYRPQDLGPAYSGGHQFWVQPSA